MKKRQHSAYGFFLILFMSFFIIGCASEPVKVDLPANHPANPQSRETAFIPPLNPFQDNIPMTKHAADSSSSMTHEKDKPAHQHQMSSEMDKMGRDSKPSHAAEGQNPEHQHKEHRQ
ncbi:MAG: hypothetical protein PVF26_11250 [Desulfobacterales bacterium]|jgi:hypothetical protein